MLRSAFVPARNSRHRTAVFALYRALLRAGRQVPLPKINRLRGVANPISYLLRKKFDQARVSTSLRLNFAALTAGYKALNLLVDARQQGSAEHTRVVKHVSLKADSIARMRDGVRYKPRVESKPVRSPILTRVETPGKLHTYVSELLPRPKDAFQGDRHIPRYAVTAQGQPFLRIKKPQPDTLSRRIHKADVESWAEQERIMEAEEELAPDAALEDMWESLVAEQLKRETGEAEGGQPLLKETYTWGVQLTWLYCLWQKQETKYDFWARGKALQKIIQDERALAEAERITASGDTAPRIIRTKDYQPLPVSQAQNIKEDPRSAYMLVEVARGAMPEDMTTEDKKEAAKHGYHTPAWSKLVKVWDKSMSRRTRDVLNARESGPYLEERRSRQASPNTWSSQQGQSRSDEDTLGW
ncbi:hypothetical protein B0I35DRAFT_49127 [Stachybotrys elegans]|uniref:Uncharacterized protein n=1 Tax=Stachybotrys elegans TaxID=80388 RepID=A0A8K0SQ93_9HYPO|nr:hypothetical protein B0I35DRAFT_49127 [Stachybotrys elegans]